MPNDINDILNSIFERNDTTGKSRAAQEAEAFLNSLNQKTVDKSASINDEISSLSKELEALEVAHSSAKKNIADMNEHLEKDGLVKEPSVEKIAETKDINKIFADVEAHTKTEILGQDEFLHKLILAFKRPFVMGKQENRPFTSMIVNGKTGTGRHSAVNLITKELASSGIIKGETPATINLSLYQNNGDNKIFIQDLFSSFQTKSQVIVLENYEKCHKSLISTLSDIVLTGKVQLGARYANQKGMLIDVGSALVPNVISSISCADKFIVFLTSKQEGEIADNFGSNFITNIEDICTTASFSSASLRDISLQTLDELKQKTKDRLGFNIDYSDGLDIYFSGKFTASGGVNSIKEHSLKCFKQLSEYKLETSRIDADCKAYLTDGVLCFEFDDQKVTIENQYEDNAGVLEVKAKMDDIIGLQPVKDYIFSLEENYKVQKIRGNLGLKSANPSMHMIFTGNPGTGKTTIARIVSRYLKAMGVLSGGQLIEVSRSDLVGKYVGHTAPLTTQIIESAIGGVLFIDEAYSLYRSDDDSFGLEAIDTLVKGMEDNRDNLIVILAGYTNEMNTFLTSNSGLKSRFPNIVEFPDYTGEELWDITLSIAKSKAYSIDDTMEEKLTAFFNEMQADNPKMHGNGRMARNIVETAILKQSQRLIKENSDNYEQLLEVDFELKA